VPTLLRIPIGILLSALAALAVMEAVRRAAPLGGTPVTLAALLVFAVGLGFAAFLWWLAARCFALLRDPATTPDTVAALRELPLGLPEGTVRALLALIVGVIGLPLLLFSQALALDAAVAGYVNGIIAGVFGYYFGARGEGPANRRIGAALDEAAAQRARADTARSDAAADSARATAEDAERDRLGRHLAVAELLLERLAPALPAGTLPAAALGAAREALRSGAPDAVRGALGALNGGSGPLPALLRAAAPLLPLAGGPLAGAAMVLGLGYSLAGGAWRRYRAALLDAPHDPALFDLGSLTPASAELRLAAAPILARVFAAQLPEPGFVAALLDAALREDAAERLWAMGGFASPAEAEEGLAQFRRALLADAVQAAATPSADTVRAGLADASPALRPAAAEAPLPGDGPEEAQAALHALALLAGEMRERRLDPLPLLRDIAP
jgi:hypothetical protein